MEWKTYSEHQVPDADNERHEVSPIWGLVILLERSLVGGFAAVSEVGGWQALPGKADERDGVLDVGKGRNMVERRVSCF